MRKKTLINALNWLQTHNPLYQDIVINHDMLVNISLEFIPEGISSKAVTIENHISEQKRYGASLVKNNDMNDLHHVIDFAGNNDLGILISCIYIDVNKSRHNPYLKLIPTIYNFSNRHSYANKEDKTPSIIIYNDHSYSKTLND